MFSASSFNALLKTLEEPPDHVKFVLATTDPQKLPATVLSRCLQFNLKRLLPEQIQQRFVTVLEAEEVAADPAALSLLARAADGSMRDGLSLLDQAVAFGAGQISLDDVRMMLGAHGGELTLELLEALADADAPQTLAKIGKIAELTPDFHSVLAHLIGDLHRIALAQQVPEILREDDPDDVRRLALSRRMAVEDVQLFYQVLLTGQADLPLASDPRSGLEMVLLRALAFRPAGAEVQKPPPPSAAPKAERAPAGPSGVAAGGIRQSPALAPVPGPADGARARGAKPVSSDSGSSMIGTDGGGRAVAAPTPDAGQTQVTGSVVSNPVPAAVRSAEDWESLLAAAELRGLSLELARHCALRSWDGRRLCLGLAPSHVHLKVAGAEQRLQEALARALACDLRLEIVSEASTDETPAQRRARDDADRLAEAEQTLLADPVAAGLRERFDAEWIPGTVTPLRTDG